MIEMAKIDRIPLKSRVLLSLRDDGEQWTTDVTDKVLAATNTNPSNRWKWVIRFYLLEMDINGMVRMVDERIADEAYYAQADVVESKYKITKLGLERLEAVLK